MLKNTTGDIKVRIVTIEKDGEIVECYEGADKRHTRHWTVTGQLDIYITGHFDEHDYEVARVLALAICREMHIPAMMLCRVMPVSSKKGRKIDQSQKKLF
jgi:hypothetical protein